MPQLPSPWFLWLHITVVNRAYEAHCKTQSPAPVNFLASVALCSSIIAPYDRFSRTCLPLIALCANITCLGPSSSLWITRFPLSPNFARLGLAFATEIFYTPARKFPELY